LKTPAKVDSSGGDGSFQGKKGRGPRFLIGRGIRRHKKGKRGLEGKQKKKKWGLKVPESGQNQPKL